MNENSILHIRLVVPRRSGTGTPLDLTESVSSFFAAHGIEVHCNERLLALPRSVPAVLTAAATAEAYGYFLAHYPYIDRLCITTESTNYRNRLAA